MLYKLQLIHPRLPSCASPQVSAFSHHIGPFFFAPPSFSAVCCDASVFAGLISKGFSSFPSPAFSFAPSGLVVFGSRPASSFFGAVSSVPDLAYLLASVLIFSRSFWASFWGVVGAAFACRLAGSERALGGARLHDVARCRGGESVYGARIL